MSKILETIGELLGLKEPKQAAMEKMAEMEPMPEPGHMTEIEPMPEPGHMTEMEHMPESGQMTDMKQMTDMEPHEHQSDDMAANPGEMKMTNM